MIKIIENINIDKKIDRLIPDSSAFMDIETTGLSHKTSAIYMIGWIQKLDNKYTLYQYMTENPAEERQILDIAIKHLNTLDNLYTFNGQSFDIPFINARSKIYNIEPLDIKSSFDMYRFIRDRGHLLDTPNLKLNTLERGLGIYREDQYDGGQLIYVYKDYEQTRDQGLKDILLLHNREDIIHMPYILQYGAILDDRSTLDINGHRFVIKSSNARVRGLDVTGTTTIETGLINYGQYTVDIQDHQFALRGSVESGNYSSNQKCIYVHKGDLDLKCRIDIPTPEEILLLKLGRDVIHPNIYHLSEQILKQNL